MYSYKDQIYYEYQKCPQLGEICSNALYDSGLNLTSSLSLVRVSLVPIEVVDPS